MAAQHNNDETIKPFKPKPKPMQAFAKIFKSRRFGQLVIMKDQHNDEAMIAVYVQDEGKTLVTHLGFGPEGEMARDSAFERVNAEAVETIVDGMV